MFLRANFSHLHLRCIRTGIRRFAFSVCIPWRKWIGEYVALFSRVVENNLFLSERKDSLFQGVVSFWVVLAAPRRQPGFG